MPGVITRKEKSMAKKIVGFVKLQVPAGKANPSPDWSSIGSARLEHHGVLQGIQCADPGIEPGTPPFPW
jgi:ribosomal protein L11